MYVKNLPCKRPPYFCLQINIFLIEKLPHFRMINLAAHSKLMVIVTFGQKPLINHKYFVCKDSQTSADYEAGKKISLFC